MKRFVVTLAAVLTAQAIGALFRAEREGRALQSALELNAKLTKATLNAYRDLGF